MDLRVRLEANAILDRLVDDGATFRRDDARRLIDLIPVDRDARFSFQGIFKGRGPGLKGNLAGIGEGRVEREAHERRVALNAPSSLKIGGYVVTHTPGQVKIDLMWGASNIDQTAHSCLLTYDRKTKEPTEMLIAKQMTLTLVFISLAYVSYVPWKAAAARPSLGV